MTNNKYRFVKSNNLLLITLRINSILNNSLKIHVFLT